MTFLPGTWRSLAVGLCLLISGTNERRPTAPPLPTRYMPVLISSGQAALFSKALPALKQADRRLLWAVWNDGTIVWNTDAVEGTGELLIGRLRMGQLEGVQAVTAGALAVYRDARPSMVAIHSAYHSIVVETKEGYQELMSDHAFAGQQAVEDRELQGTPYTELMELWSILDTVVLRCSKKTPGKLADPGVVKWEPIPPAPR